MSQPTGAPAPQTRPGESDPDMGEALSRVPDRTEPRHLTSYERRDVRTRVAGIRRH